jgi:PadR family transcriptional regulator AphA
MSLHYAVLGLLAERPHTGYGLLKQFERSLAYAWPASHSQIYPELARLRDEGLIRQTGTGPRGSKTYELTEAGLDEVRRWLRTDPSRSVRSEPLLRIFFLWLLEPAEAAAYLRRELEHLRSALAELERIERDSAQPSRPHERAYRLALDHGLALSRARVEWAERALEAFGDAAG